MIFSLLLAGGPFMFATLGTSLIALGVFISKALFLWGRGAVRREMLDQVLATIEAGDLNQAMRLCAADGSPMGKVMRAALQRGNRSEREIRRAVEGVAIEEIPRIKGGTVYLPQLSNLATLFGLIGTIHGLIISFSGAGGENAATRQAMLSKGISIAFYNTFFGLAVATLSVVLYLVLLTKTNGTMGLMERSVAQVVDSILWFREKHSRAPAA